MVINVTLDQCVYQFLPLSSRMPKHRTIQSSPFSFTKTAEYAISQHWSLSSGNSAFSLLKDSHFLAARRT